MTFRSSFLLPSLATLAIGGSFGSGVVACSSNTIVHVNGNGADTDGGDGTGDTEGGVAAGDDAGGGGPVNSDHGPYPAPTGLAPQVETSGGAVLKAPHIVPVFFPGDALQTQLMDFLTKIGPSQYLAANVAEYGVGAATVGAPIVMASNPPTSLTISSMASYVATNVVPKATVDSNTLFVVFIPASTIVTLGQGSQTCKDVGGYHESTGSGKQVAYAIVPRCQSFVNQQPNLSTLLQVTTASGTHELIEAMTDPYPNQTPAYNSVDANHALWQYILGGAETGDMCAQTPHSFGMNAELGYAVQRSWSNKAAASHHDPCVPQPAGEVYFNAVYEPTETVNLGGNMSTKAMALTVGQTKTVEVTLVSDGPMNAFNVAGIPLNPGELTISFDKKGGFNGDKLKMTVKLNSAPTGGTPLAPFFIVSTYGQAQQIWPVGVIAQ